MRVTLTAVTAAAGGHVGPGGMHEDVLAAAAESLAGAVADGRLIDAQAHPLGGDLLLLLSHDRGEDDAGAHEAAWDAIAAAAAVAGELQLHAPGEGLAADAFPGSLHGAGPSVAEFAFEERPSEPFVLLAGAGTATGAFNLPLYRAFADPFNTAGLVLSDALHQGCSFEVHDTAERRKIVFNAPEELYDLLALIGSPRRFAVKRVVSRASGEVAAVASTDRAAQVAGGHGGVEGPVALVRCEGDLPVTGEVVEPFATPVLVEGFARGSHYGPWMPVPLDRASPGRFGGPPRAVALGYQLAAGRLIGPRDLFDDPSFDSARARANDAVELMRAHGPFEPHRVPLDAIEHEMLPGVVSNMESRWSPM